LTNKKPSCNRPTDPFGGPPQRGNTISFTLVIIAFAIFALVQWTNGGLGGILGGLASSPTGTATPETAQTSSNNAETNGDSETPEVEAVVMASPTEAAAPQATATKGMQAPAVAQQPGPTANSPPAERASDLPAIAYGDLPPEAHDTIALIESDGPFPFSRDGITFQNRERILPRHPEGYYREYTVITPGSNDRGARRIVTGEAGEMYYTDDHYGSFSEIIYQ
jgi:ribonuclease T1